MRPFAVTLAIAFAALSGLHAQRQTAPAPAADAGPRLVIETAKGTMEVRLFPAEAPKTVEHLLNLVKKNFYRGQRFHRVTPALVQWGDPASRDMTRKSMWGAGGSGARIGISELSKKLIHQRGSLGFAHEGAPERADSQLYIMKIRGQSLDGTHVIVGQVTTGLDVIDKIEVADVIKAITVK